MSHERLECNMHSICISKNHFHLDQAATSKCLCACVCLCEGTVDVHWVVEYSQYKFCTPCTFVCKSLICIMRNMACESSFPKMPRVDSCNVQSIERDLF